MRVAISDFGATVVQLWTPDRDGRLADIVLGYDDANGYFEGSSFFGGTIGRYANRIAQASFDLNGETFYLNKNEGAHCLHGGSLGFHKRLWRVDSSSEYSLRLQYFSPDGEEGFPGNLVVNASFVLSEANELRIEYRATTDRATIINLTNHSYFNLAGHGSGEVLDHHLLLHANVFTPINNELIPTGELRQVRDTPLDFTSWRRVGDRIDASDDQLQYAQGYDHNFVLDKKAFALVEAAQVFEQSSGRLLTILTNQPGVQFYSGNHLPARISGKDGAVYGRRSGLCLETQHFPDSPHHPHFPSTILNPGETYDSVTIYRAECRGELTA
jgi:aldose 1-epimerase